MNDGQSVIRDAVKDSTRIPPEVRQRSDSQSSLISRASRLRSLLTRYDGVLALIVYLALALIWYRGVIRDMHGLCACGLVPDRGDNAAYLWWLAYVPYAVLHGASILHPTVIWAPGGINMAGTTASLVLGFVAAPITLLWGPFVSYNVMMISASVLGAWAANRLCRYITKAPFASLVAGVFYGFGSYEIGQLTGHLPLLVIFCPPLAALCVLRYLDGVDSRRKFIVKLTLVLVVQALISLEVLFTMTIVGAVPLLVAWLMAPRARRRAMLAKIALITAPYVIMFIAISWYLARVFSAPLYAKDVGLQWPVDALSFFTPMEMTWLGGHSFLSLSSMFHSGQTETDAYIGLPMIVLAAIFLIRRWPSRSAKILASLFASTVIWILGARLWVAGQPTIWMPFSLLAKLPLFDDAMDGRIALFLDLTCSVTIAMWLATPRKQPKSLLALILGLLATAAVMPDVASPSGYNVSPWQNPTFFRTPIYKQYLRPGELVLPIVWGYLGTSPMWLAEDHMYYRLASGAWLFSPPLSWQTKITDDLWANQPSRGDGSRLRTWLIGHHIGDVVVEDDAAGLWGKTLHDAGLSVTAKVGGVEVLHVPSRWRK
jgi:hypothetical protein